MSDTQINPNRYKPKDNKNERLLNSDLQDAIYADAFNLTPDFFTKYRPIFDNIRNNVRTIVASYGYKDEKRSSIQNPLNDYKSILFSTVEKKAFQKDLMEQQSSNLSSGMRSITNEDTSSGVETQIIQTFQRLTNDVFALMNEYRVGVSLIPELKRVVKLIVRDILNANEITKRAFKNIYQIKGDNSFSFNEKEEDALNKIIDDKITDIYRIEEKAPTWLDEALKTGAKPILVVPYKDILEQALTLANKTNSMYGTEEFKFKDNALSIEDLEELVFKTDFTSNKFKNESRNLLYNKPIINNLKKYHATEEDDEPYPVTEEFKEIIDEETVNKIFNLGIEELYEALDIEIKASKHNKGLEYGVEAVEENINETVESIRETIRKIEENDIAETSESKKERVQDEIKDKIREQLKWFMGELDKNIQVVNDDFSKFSLGKSTLATEQRYKKYNKTNVIDGMFIKNRKELDDITGVFDKQVLLMELDPEYVIPITVGSEHVAYYIYEHDAYTGPTPSSSRKTTSFTQLIKATGYGDDKNLVNTTSGITVTPYDPQMSSVFSPISMSAATTSLLNSDLLEGTKRTEIMKQIIYKTLSHRMNDPSLIDNKCFQDAIMNLIREGYIINRKVQFTFVPATNMVYFAHDIDDKGMPHSIFDGTLLQIYMYLAGIVSGTMSIVSGAADKEKLEVNIGLSDQIGLTLTEIQKNLATRNVHVRSFFDNIGSVLRNSAVYSRMTIPVVDGEKLYEVSAAETNGNPPIDNDFIQARLASILSALPCPPAILNTINEIEFSRGIINQNIEYRNSVIGYQTAYSRNFTKLYRLLILYSKLEVPSTLLETDNSKTATSKISDEDKYIKIKDINVLLSPPMYLNMTSISESFTSIEPVIDSYIKYRYGDNLEDEVTKNVLKRVKRELVQFFAPNIDFDTMNDMFDRIEKDFLADIIDEKKKKLISDKLMEG
jgi:hypothetical protein